MRFTIVTPVRDGVGFIEQCLASVRGQAHPDVEHIVVDGGSSDGTLDVLKLAPGIRWTSEVDAGMYDAINKGFEKASGDALAYLNADDVYADASIVATVAAIFEAHQDVDVVYGDYGIIGADGRPAGTSVSGPFDLERLKRENCVPPHSTFVRKRVIEEGGFWFDPSLRYAGDWDWVLRMALAGRRFLYAPAVLSYFRHHERSLTATVGWALKVREWRAVCGKNGISFPRMVGHQLAVGPVRRRLRRLARNS